jgi:uncharacterized protein YkwD
LSSLVLVAALAPAESAAACGRRATDRAAVICEINSARVAAGRRALQSRPSLTAGARGHARDMVTRHYFGHDSPEGDGPVQRARRAGYLRHAVRWRIGEILIWSRGATLTAAGAVRAWLASPGHRRVMLSPAFGEVGAAAAAGAPRGDPDVTPATTIAVMFGRRTF